MNKKVADTVHAYTPGLKVTGAMTIQKVRRLPLPGESLAKEGDTVSFDTVVARTHIPGEPFILNAAKALDLLMVTEGYLDLPKYMKKKVGDPIKEGEEIAGYNALWGLVKKSFKSPIQGTMESVSILTGQVVIRAPPIPVEIDAYIPGRIVKVLPQEGVIVETKGAFIQGIFGICGENHGELALLVESSKDVLEAETITEKHKGKILVGGSMITRDAMDKALEVGAAGVVVGGVDEEDLMDFVGRDIGVAITGEEQLGLTLIITEGFSKMNMSERAFKIFKELDGYDASINGSTQIRAGVIRPEIIIPYSFEEVKRDEELSLGMQTETPVRLIREPYFGEIGKCISFPTELHKIESESRVRVMEVELEDKRKVIVPRANVEIIEE